MHHYDYGVLDKNLAQTTAFAAFSTTTDNQVIERSEIYQNGYSNSHVKPVLFHPARCPSGARLDARHHDQGGMLDPCQKYKLVV